MLSRLFATWTALQVILALPIVPQQSNHPNSVSDVFSSSSSSTWTDERLCVLKMGSSCPIGFSEDQIKLSVQTDVMPRDTDRDGKKLIIMGKAGETSLTRNTYESVYTLTLTTCCK